MDKIPVPTRRRTILETAIRIVDLVVYFGLFLGGVWLAIAPSGDVTGALHGHQWLMVVWAAFLLGGGLVGFVGRLTRFWMVENPGTVAAAFGSLIFLVVLTPYVFASFLVAVTYAFVLTAFCFMVRRWLELQLFGTEPTHDWRGRWLAAMHRRTQNVVPHI
jgi:hypothetical protein